MSTADAKLCYPRASNSDCSRCSHGPVGRLCQVKAPPEADRPQAGGYNTCEITLTFALAADFFEQLDLDLLNFEEPIVLPPQEMIDFFVQVPDFELGFEVDFVIVL
jgi:hypothetical protein